MPPSYQIAAKKFPPGVSFTDNGDGTATFSGIPTVPKGWIYYITITASADGSRPAP